MVVVLALKGVSKSHINKKTKISQSIIMMGKAFDKRVRVPPTVKISDVFEEVMAPVNCIEFASRIGFDRKVSCLTYFYLTRFPTEKSEFQTRFEICSRYSHNLFLNHVVRNNS